MLLVPAPKNRSIVRRIYPAAAIGYYETGLLNPAHRFYIRASHNGVAISSTCPTRSKAWKDAAQRIARRTEARANG